MSVKQHRINKHIMATEVRLIDDESDQQSIIATARALEIARERGLDLVEVAPNAKPPVCKIINYGKHRYEIDKRNREAKKNQSQVRLKEIRMQPKIESHDLQFKSKHVLDFLQEGNKCKVTIRFRGRELAHTHLGKDVLWKVLEILGEENYNLDNPPTMEGRFMSMILSPKKKKSG